MSDLKNLDFKNIMEITLEFLETTQRLHKLDQSQLEKERLNRAIEQFDKDYEKSKDDNKDNPYKTPVIASTQPVRAVITTKFEKVTVKVSKTRDYSIDAITRKLKATTLNLQAKVKEMKTAHMSTT